MINETFGVSYHSKYGAIQESRHVFIEAGLGMVLPTHSHIRLLEMGFGSGLNALLTLQLINAMKGKTVFYETVETHPIPPEQVKALNYPVTVDIPETQFYALHEAPWNEPMVITPSFTLLKWLDSLQDAPLTGGYDLVYFDAFAPTSQPELWEKPVFSKIFDHMAPGGVLVTYCAKGVVKRTLRDIGFTVEGIPGPPGKREMTRAVKV
ncbi:MAG: tRNA (5-methylaminomethyl-2-thiouridine)(34)-methyltransferase MnmD [Saprospiraceae bacterium]